MTNEGPAWHVLDEARPILWAEYRYGSGRAVSCVFRLEGGELGILSPPAGFDKQAYAELDRYGKITAIVAPNGYHHLGIPTCLEAYPNAKLYAHPKAAKRILAKNPALAGKSFEPLETLASKLPSSAMLTTPPEMRIPDVVARFDSARGPIWYVNDTIANQTKPSKNPFLRWVLRVTKSGPGFTINHLICLAMVKKQKPYWRWMREQLAAHPPVTLIVGHGKPVDRADVATELLRQIDLLTA